jgi:chromosome segregation ATPase
VSAHERQVSVLREARRRDSITKRARVLQALTELEDAGEPITIAALARHARVSTWLIYSEGIREHVAATRARQAAQPAADRRCGRSPSTASLRTDLELARAEITTLRVERDQLRNGMRQQLGRDLDAMSSAGLSTRVEELTRRNQQLSEQNHQLGSDNTALSDRVAELEADLAAARTGLRRMIREQNTPDRATSSRPHE